VADHITQAPNIHGTHLFDEYARRLSVDINLGTE